LFGSDTISGINPANKVTAHGVNIAIKNVKNQKILVEGPNCNRIDLQDIFRAAKHFFSDRRQAFQSISRKYGCDVM
jgi:hypothetical protein